MANKTIYVKNEELWNKAKKIAGKEGEGLSGVIAEALAEFVRKHEAAAEGQVVHRFTVEHDFDGEVELERVAFAGREIDSRSFQLPPFGPESVIATAYVTKGGRFVLTLRMESRKTPFHYATYSHPREIAKDESLLSLGGEDNDDIQEWVESVHRRHFEATAAETWIE